MSPEKSGQFQEQDEFVAYASAELERFYISPEVRNRVERAGCSIRGVSYFEGLFAEDDMTHDMVLHRKLRSIFVGASAHRYDGLAAGALIHLQDLDILGEEELRDQLIGRVTSAIASERQHANYKSWGRIEGLQRANKRLGRPLVSRILGGVGTAFVLHART